MLEEALDRFASYEWEQWFLLDIFTLNLRALVLLACCFVLIRSIKLSASGKHSILVLAAQGLLLLPVFLLCLPPLEIVVRVTSPIITSVFPVATSSVTGSSVVAMVESSKFDLSDLNIVGICVYCSVAVFLISRIFISNLKLWFVINCRSHIVKQDYWQAALESNKRNLEIKRKVRIVYSSYISSPATWGFLRPVILLPNYAVQWPDHLIKSTLLHELAHIKRFDWPIQQLTKLICALYWVNPLVWRLQGAIHGYAETASDDIALKNGVRASDYARHLLHVASQMRQHTLAPYAALAMAKRGVCSELKSRVGLILSHEIQRVPISKPYFVLSSLAILGLLLPAMSMKAKYIEQVVTKKHSNQAVETANVPGSGEALVAIPLSTQTIQLQRLESLESTLLVPFFNPNRSSLEAPDIVIDAENQVEVYTSEVPAKEVFEIVKTALTQKLRQSKTNDPEVAAKPHANGARLKQELAALVNNERVKAALQSQVELNLPPTSDKLVSTQAVAEVGGPIAAPMDSQSNTNVRPAIPTNLVIPKYPDRARAKGIEGEVTVEYALDESGRVTAAKVVSASPSKYFDKEVLRAIKKSAFKPKRVDGVAVATRGLTEKYVFVLES